MLRFDEHFIRGPLGRHAGSNKYWPHIDDRTGALCTNQGRQATGPSEWQYIVDGIKDLDEEINIDEPSWIEEVKSKFQQFMEDYERKQTVSAVPESFMANGICEKASLRFDLNTVLAGPPVNVKFYQMNPGLGKRSKRIISSSSEEIEPAVVKRKWSGTESNESTEIGVASPASRREISSSRKRSFVPLGMQSSDEEELEETLMSDEKSCTLSLPNDVVVSQRQAKKKSGKKKPSRHNMKRRIQEVEEAQEHLTVCIEEDDKKRLRDFLSAAFFNVQQSLPGTSGKVLKAKSDDLQLLGYWPGRDDYDIEQNNDAERLISQIVINPGSGFDEQFENAVKLASIRSYNLVLAARNASKRMIREHGLVNLFFDKIMNVGSESKYRGYSFNKQYYTKQRFRKHYADFLKPVHQVTLKSELEELIDSLAARDTLAARVKELQKLKDAGNTVLPGHLKTDLDNIKIVKRKRKTFNSLRRKGILKYNRYKRWTQKHAESDE
ncbi:unnamed protein product [Enterobius vermicularis]|uniref:SET domain-containing protein n=1 Tax=Enterobius vermicularis TaxID=51028 RepID=A0A0N4V4G8_ENTVE|nr:unnamed protein product [Enterobius vermicularis]